jgi:glycosyltransferase involved in cell wall biosynthesis
MKENEILFLFTTGYPFGIIEDFLHNEVLTLSIRFRKVVLFVPSIVSELPLRTLPENIEIVFVKESNKIKSLFYKHFWKAYFMDIKMGQTNPIRLREFKNAITYFSKSLDIVRIADEEVKKRSLKNITFYSYWFNESALAIAQLKIKHKKSIAVCRAHGWDVYKERHNPTYLPFRNWISENLDQVCCVSNYGANYLNQTYSINSDKFSIKYLGTLPIHQKALNKGIPLNIISCSNIIPLKRIQLIVEVLAQLKITIKWTHIGDGVLKNEIIKIVKEKLHANISVDFKGEISNLEVRNLYENESFDLFISLSETEGLPVSMMEALSVGVPIIATNVGGVGEIVIDKKTGWLISERNLLNEAIEAILTYVEMTDDEKESLRKNCIKHWELFFNAELNYSLFYSELLSGKS